MSRTRDRELATPCTVLYVPSYLEHGYYPYLEPGACILRDPSSSSLSISHRAALVVMAKGSLSQLDRENVQKHEKGASSQ